MESSQAETWGPAIQAVQPVSIGALPVVFPILERLGVREATNDLVASDADIDLGRIVWLLTINRLLAPQPLYQVEGWLRETVVPEVLGVAADKVYDMRLGRALDRLHPVLGDLWARLVGRAVAAYDLDIGVLHWDITSIYFEGAYTDSELVTYGYSRDHRPDTKQVNLELDVAHDGYTPVHYQILAGNTADITRPVPHLHALLRLFAREELATQQLRPLLVSDSKMVTAEGVAACHRHDFGYLGPLPNGVATTQLLASVTTEELAAHPLEYRPQRAGGDFVPYQGIWRAFRIEHDQTVFTDRALVVWSAGKQRLDEQKRKTLLKRLLNGLEKIDKQLNTLRYKKRSYVETRIAKMQQRYAAVKGLVDVNLTGEDSALVMQFRVNQDKLSAVRQLDGRYALVTNRADLTANDALCLFKGQDGIEKRIRCAKGPLVVHPLFVRSDERIEGLVFITLLALLTRAILERSCRQCGLNLTADRILGGFAPLQAVDLTWADGSRKRHAATLSEFQTKVLESLGWPRPEIYIQATPHLH